jgi:hypothetical protein
VLAGIKETEPFAEAPYDSEFEGFNEFISAYSVNPYHSMFRVQSSAAKTLNPEL